MNRNNTCFGRLFLLFLLVLLSQVSWAAYKPGKIADSLQIARWVAEADSLRKTQPDSTLRLVRFTAGKSQEMGLKKLKWESLIIQAHCFNSLGERDSALAVLEDLLQETQAAGDTVFLIDTRLVSAKVYQKNYDFKNAVTNLVAAQELMTPATPFDLRFDLYNNLGQTHRKMKDYESALKYYRVLERDFFFQLTSTQKFYLYMNIGNVFFSQRDYPNTELQYEKAYAVVSEARDSANLATITFNLGALNYRQEKYDQAERYVSESLQYDRAAGKRLAEERAYRLLGAIHYSQQNYQKSIDYYHQALQLARDIDNPKSIAGNYKNLYLNYQDQAELSRKPADYQRALQYQSLWAGLLDSLYQSDIADQILEMETKYETEKKDAEIKLLAQSNQVKADQLMIESQEREYLLVLLSFLLAIVAIILFFMSYYRQLTKRIQKQSQLIFDQKEKILNQNIRLKKALDTQNRIYSIIGHDLRSPLISVANFVEMADFFLEEGKLQELEQLAKQMHSTNEQVIELTDNLQLWANSQSEGLKIQYDCVSMNEVLDGVYSIYQAAAAKKGISLRWEEQEDCQLWTDRNILHTICRNLVSNALKFTPTGGSVRLTSTLVNEHVWITVEDTGIGMNPRQLDNLFDIDKNEVRRGTKGEKSTGLGLSVIKEFIDLLHCELKISSQENEGTRFSFSVDLYSDDIRQRTEIRAQSLPSVEVVG